MITKLSGMRNIIISLVLAFSGALASEPVDLICSVVKIRNLSNDRVIENYNTRLPISLNFSSGNKNIIVTFPNSARSETYRHEGVSKLQGKQYVKYRSKTNNLIFKKSNFKSLFIVGPHSNRVLLITKCKRKKYEFN